MFTMHTAKPARNRDQRPLTIPNAALPTADHGP